MVELNNNKENNQNSTNLLPSLEEINELQQALDAFDASSSLTHEDLNSVEEISQQEFEFDIQQLYWLCSLFDYFKEKRILLIEKNKWIKSILTSINNDNNKNEMKNRFIENRIKIGKCLINLGQIIRKIVSKLKDIETDCISELWLAEDGAIFKYLLGNKDRTTRCRNTLRKWRTSHGFGGQFDRTGEDGHKWHEIRTYAGNWIRKFQRYGVRLTRRQDWQQLCREFDNLEFVE